MTHGQSLEMDVNGDWFSPKKPDEGQFSMMTGVSVVALIFSLIGLLRMITRNCRNNHYQVIHDDLSQNYK